MDLKEIKELIELIAEKRVAEFEMENGEFKLRIRHFDSTPPATSMQPQQVVIPVPAPPLAMAPPLSAQLPAAAPTVEPKAEKETHKIKAPIVGTFYRAPSPTSEPFVRVGSHVAPGTVLCIIEAMKLMNEIEADVSGEVVEIYVENGQAVEYGQPLFGIKIE